jgi:hypothetical protein
VIDEEIRGVDCREVVNFNGCPDIEFPYRRL